MWCNSIRKQPICSHIFQLFLIYKKFKKKTVLHKLLDSFDNSYCFCWFKPPVTSFDNSYFFWPAKNVHQGPSLTTRLRFLSRKLKWKRGEIVGMILRKKNNLRLTNQPTNNQTTNQPISNQLVFNNKQAAT